MLFNFEHLISNLAITLLHFCWQATLIAFILKVILTLSHKHSIKFRYYAAIVALITCVVTPVYTFCLFYQDITYFTPHELNSSLIVFNTVSQSTPLSGSSHIVSFVSSIFMVMKPHFLVILWIIGVFIMLIKFIYELHETFCLTKVGVSPVGKDIEQMVFNISSQFGINRDIRIFKSTLVNVPVVIGWFKPTILLPVAIAIGLDKHQLELIIAHELAHVRRLDFLINFFQGIIQVLFFFHPCVYWINKMVREEREYICDSIALNRRNNVFTARLDLAKALLNIEELKEGNLSLVAVAASDGHLKNRVNRIILNEKLKLPSAKGFLVAILTFAFSLTTIAVTSDFSIKMKQIKKNNQLVGQIEETVTQELVLPQTIVNTSQSMKRERVKLKKALNKKQLKPVSLTHYLPVTPKQKKNSRKQIVLLENIDLAKFDLIEEMEQLKKQQTSILTKQLRQPLIKNIGLNKKPISIQSEKLNVDQVFKVKKLLTTTLAKKPFKVAILNTKNMVDFKEPKAILTPYPSYPELAYNSKLSEKVKVDFTINEHGKVTNVQFNQNVSWLFTTEIRRVIKRWRYEPAERDGIKVTYNASIYFDFELPQERPFVRYLTGSRIRRKLR